MKLVALSGSRSERSKTLLVVNKAIDYAKDYDPQIETEIIHLGDYDIQYCDGRDPSLSQGDTKKVIDLIVNADAFIVGTPIYRGSMTGALKNVFDIIPNDSLRGKVIGFIATGGSPHHFLAIEHQLKPLAGYFHAYALPSAVYAHNDHFSASTLVDTEIMNRLNELGKSIVDFYNKGMDRSVRLGLPDIPRKQLSNYEEGYCGKA